MDNLIAFTAYRILDCIWFTIFILSLTYCIVKEYDERNFKQKDNDENKYIS